MCGDRPGGFQFQRSIRAQWPSVSAPIIISHRDGYLFLLMKNQEDCKLVVGEVPIT